MAESGATATHQNRAAEQTAGKTAGGLADGLAEELAEEPERREEPVKQTNNHSIGHSRLTPPGGFAIDGRPLAQQTRNLTIKTCSEGTVFGAPDQRRGVSHPGGFRRFKRGAVRDDRPSPSDP